MVLSHNHKYEIGHYYKRTYESGNWIIFTVTHTDNRYIDSLIVKTPNNEHLYRNRLSIYFHDATTIELSYDQAVALAL